MGSKGKDTCLYKACAESLRGKGGVDHTQAKLEQTDGEGSITEYVRGKDLARHLREHPEKMERLVRPLGPGRDVEDQIRDMVHFFIHKKQFVKAERKYKKPKPGRTGLVKFPKTLLPCQDQTWDESQFYAYVNERPTSMKFYIAACLVPVATIGACLFPLAPLMLRVVIVYLLAAVVCFMLSVIALRYVVHAAVWAVTGYELWLWPNMMDERVAFHEAFSPMYSIDAPPTKSQWKQRVVAGFVLASVFSVLYFHHPDLETIKEEAAKAHENLADYLDLAGKKKVYIDDGNSTNSTGGPAGARPGQGPGGNPHQQRHTKV
ncbi:hypothetical protein FOA52_000708 [Chlamydomonas sp. UWO 241]|nr:hypothetical protein FOA52_000708 [Chlamydomonas sp. UWO 241]